MSATTTGSGSRERQIGTVGNLLCGASAGFMSNLICYPLDSNKAQRQFQLDKVTPEGRFMQNQLYKTIRLYYRGYAIVLTMSIPSVSLYFLTYEKSKGLFPVHWGPYREFVAGVIAQTASSIIATPRDVIAQRLQVQHLQKDQMKDRYKSPLHALRNIIKTEGVFKGLYRGYFQELSLWSMYGGLYLAFFFENETICSKFDRPHRGDSSSPYSCTMCQYCCCFFCFYYKSN